MKTEVLQLKRSLKITALGTDEINIALDGERKNKNRGANMPTFPPFKCQAWTLYFILH